ncbi:MAG TPA: sortase [Terriglobales bacterium]|nr:sortase [Terriglobales bacterium]
MTGKKIVEPTDLAVIQPTADAQLTLLTCYPTYYIGPAPQRLVVFSKLVGVKGGEERPAQAKPVAAGVP